MSGWRKRQIADSIENELTCPPCHGDCNQGRDCPANPPRPESQSIAEWYKENNVEITWLVIGILIMGTLDSLAKGHYWFAGINFILLLANYFLRSSGFRK